MGATTTQMGATTTQMGATTTQMGATKTHTGATTTKSRQETKIATTKRHFQGFSVLFGQKRQNITTIDKL